MRERDGVVAGFLAIEGIEGEVVLLRDGLGDLGEVLPDSLGVVTDVDAVVDSCDGSLWKGIGLCAAFDQVYGLRGLHEILGFFADLACFLSEAVVVLADLRVRRALS